MAGGVNLPPPIPLAEAHARLLAAVAPLPAEELPLAKANGRFLAADLTARRTQPFADLSAMDGYAMRGDDLSGPWQVVGESAAGHPFAGQLATGQAIRISTGACLPAGGGAVLLQEDALRTGDRLALSGADGPEVRHIRRKGFDFATGDPLLPRGAMLTPARIALALTGGHARAPVGRLPRVAVLDSGDELAVDPAALGPGQLPASNGAMLAAMVAPLAREVQRIGPVADRLEALVAAFAAAGEAEVIVTSGGASVGDHDLIRPALEAWGAKIDFWRIAIKPGKPLLVARKGPQWIIGLPGNPVSAHVTCFLFVLPLLRALAGASKPQPRAMALPLDGSLRAIGHRAEFLRARFGPAGVVPLVEQDSSALLALSTAECLIHRAINAPAAAQGELVQVYWLHNGGSA